MHNHSPFQRQTPASPLQSSLKNDQLPSRKPSIVELLSSPPPLPQTPDISLNNYNDEINSFSLSRNTSISSRTSSSFNHHPNHLTHSNTNSSLTNGVDWSEIPLYELIESNKLISINSSYSIQKAFETLINHNLTSIPVSRSKSDSTDLANCLTFDYGDLNTYLLLIMNKINFNDLCIDEVESGSSLTLKQKHEFILNVVNKGKHGEEVPVDFIVKLHPKNPFLKFQSNEPLLKVMEALGNGVHRVAITDEFNNNKIVGILSQRRLIKFMWENARRFPSLDFYLNSTLQDLKIGSNNPITIYEDQLLIEALQKMFNERVSSLAVIDKKKLLIGNISIVDVKNVSSTKNSHLLFKSVLNFISYNLSQKGIEEGQDQFPIFHVNSQSSLGRVIAKLVATQSHRLWIVENRQSLTYNAPSNASPPPPTTIDSALKSTNPEAPPADNYNNLIDKNGRPGKLIGVVTLTDILGLFAQSKNLNKKIDPQFARNQRRRSSTSTTGSLNSGSSANQPPSPLLNNNQEIFRKAYTNKTDNVFTKDS